jgi:hypothetical protein
MRQISIVHTALCLTRFMTVIVLIQADHICLRLHLRLERMLYQVFNPCLLPPHLWHVMAGLVVCLLDRRLPDHKSHHPPALL